MDQRIRLVVDRWVGLDRRTRLILGGIASFAVGGSCLLGCMALFLFGGNGDAAQAAAPPPMAGAPAVAAAPAVPALPPPTVPAPPADADERAARRMTEYSTEKIAEGYYPFGEPLAGTLRQGRRIDYPLSLAAGDCYTLAAFGGRGVRDIDMELIAPSGRRVAKDEARDSRPIVNLCVQEAGPYRARVSMFAGRGPYTFQAYRVPGAAALATGIAASDPTVQRRMNILGGRLVARGFRPVGAMQASGTLEHGQVQTFDANISEGGSCYTFAAFGGTGLNDIDVFLENEGGVRLRRDVGRSSIGDVSYFVGGADSFRVKVLAYRGHGPFAYQVYRREDQACP